MRLGKRAAVAGTEMSEGARFGCASRPAATCEQRWVKESVLGASPGRHRDLLRDVNNLGVLSPLVCCLRHGCTFTGIGISWHVPAGDMPVNLTYKCLGAWTGNGA